MLQACTPMLNFCSTATRDALAQGFATGPTPPAPAFHFKGCVPFRSQHATAHRVASLQSDRRQCFGLRYRPASETRTRSTLGTVAWRTRATLRDETVKPVLAAPLWVTQIESPRRAGHRQCTLCGGLVAGKRRGRRECHGSGVVVCTASVTSCAGLHGSSSDSPPPAPTAEPEGWWHGHIFVVPGLRLIGRTTSLEGPERCGCERGRWQLLTFMKRRR